MMDFQIHALAADDFFALNKMSEAQLASYCIVKYQVTECPGTPCRVSLCDASVGETAFLLNYTHLDSQSPYHGSHAIFVRANARQAKPAVNEVPDVLRTRVISVRSFDTHRMMVDAQVIEGERLKECLGRLFERTEVEFVHLHNAGPGCFAACATRAGEFVYAGAQLSFCEQTTA